MASRRNILQTALAVPVAAVSVGVLAGRSLAAARSAGSRSRYTMTTFTYADEHHMYVYESWDATNFTRAKAPMYAPPSGLLRDPSIFRHTDGYYYVTYTCAWKGNQIGLARSPDRLSWTFLRTITVPLSGVVNSWAPEWFVDQDGSVNIVLTVHLSRDAPSGFAPYKMTATNASLTAWSTPVRLGGLPDNYLDTFVVRIGTTYHAVLRNTLSGSIDFARASTFAGPYTVWKTRNFVDLNAEGPCLVQLDNGGWRLYLEDYHQHRFYYTDSYDIFQTWTKPTLLPMLSGTVKHLTVLKETVPGVTGARTS